MGFSRFAKALLLILAFRGLTYAGTNPEAMAVQVQGDVRSDRSGPIHAGDILSQGEILEAQENSGIVFVHISSCAWGSIQGPDKGWVGQSTRNETTCPSLSGIEFSSVQRNAFHALSDLENWFMTRAVTAGDDDVSIDPIKQTELEMVLRPLGVTNPVLIKMIYDAETSRQARFLEITSNRYQKYKYTGELVADGMLMGASAAATAENSDRKKLISAFSELLPGGAADPRNLGFIRWAFRLIQRPQTGEFRPLRIAKAIRKH